MLVYSRKRSKTWKRSERDLDSFHWQVQQLAAIVVEPAVVVESAVVEPAAAPLSQPSAPAKCSDQVTAELAAPVFSLAATACHRHSS